MELAPFPPFSFKTIMQTNQTYRQNQDEDKMSHGTKLGLEVNSDSELHSSVTSNCEVPIERF